MNTTTNLHKAYSENCILGLKIKLCKNVSVDLQSLIVRQQLIVTMLYQQ